MPKKKKSEGQFTDLTWNDLEKWAGAKVVARGRNYQRNGYVSDLAQTEDRVLVAWVMGSERYATKVAMGEDGLPESSCTCPYGDNCKHGVATVVEYLKRVNDNKPVPKAKKIDERLALLEQAPIDDYSFFVEDDVSFDDDGDIELFLKGKTKTQLTDLIRKIAREYPEISRDLSDQQQVVSGDMKKVSARLRRKIRDLGDEPGWQNYWEEEGYTPDFSGVRKTLEALLAAGHADEVLALGKELVSTCLRLSEESHDEGETAMEVADCLPVIVNALDQSALDTPDKLNWALDAVLKDPFDICDAFAEFLHRRHPKPAWRVLADQLLRQLVETKPDKNRYAFNRDYARDRLSNWAIHALEQAGRHSEVTPLCEREAKKTGSYNRLVTRLISEKRYQDAEKWIHKGIIATEKNLPGIARTLQDKLLEIRTLEKNWPVVAAMQAEEFVRRPSGNQFTDCRKAGKKIKVWPVMRECLLKFLETGWPPWKQKEWQLPSSSLSVQANNRQQRFPIFATLIDIAILEKDPARVLHWYDKLPKKRFGWYGVNEDEIAVAVQTYAPDRAVAIWQKKAEDLIAQVKPSSYQEAAKYLRKAGNTMTKQKQQAQWNKYLQKLREIHARKRRLMEIMDGLNGRPIVKRNGT